MRVTREMYAGDADVYTDLLYIVTRSLGVNPMQVTLGQAVAKQLAAGAGYSETVYAYRTYLEGFLERVLKGAKRA